MNYKGIVDRKLSVLMQERLLEFYTRNNLKHEKIWLNQECALRRREMLKYDYTLMELLVTQKGIDYLKAKNLI